MTKDPLDSTFSPKAKRFVGCFDVLGFKKYVAATPLDTVVAAYEHLLQEAKYFTEIPVAKFYSGGGGRVDIEKVPYQIFSDTILIWSAGSGGEHIANFLQSCCCLVAASVGARLPLRGGVAYGECLMDPEGGKYIGQAIVDAHETEKIQEWIGAGLHQSCFTSPIGTNLVKFADVLEYAVPVKDGFPVIEHTLRWHGYADVNVEEILEELLTKASGDQHAERKIKNALSFCESVDRVLE